MGPVLCGLIPPLEILLHAPSPGAALAVVAGGRVLAASEAALQAGVHGGMRPSQAEAVCPGIEFKSPDPEGAERLRQQLSAALYDLSPVVQVRLDGHAWMDLEGLCAPAQAVRRFRSHLERAGAQPRLGLAPGPFAAALAAAGAAAGRLRRVTDPGRFLASLPVSVLGLEAESEERLRLLGLTTLGELQKLPPRQLETQIGAPGRLAVALARGEEPLPLAPWKPPQLSAYRRQFEPPLEDRQALAFVVCSLASDLGREMEIRGTAVRRIRLRLTAGGLTSAQESLLRQPLAGAGEISPLLLDWVSLWRLTGGVEEASLEALELAAPKGRQLRLWRSGEESKARLEAALDRFQARYGKASVGFVEHHLPQSPIPAHRFRLNPR